MPVDTYSVLIEKPQKMVFDYVTTPAWWPIYHPSSQKVDPYITHSLGVDEKVLEYTALGLFHIAKFDIHWVGKENNGLSRFVMTGHADEMGGADGTITYEIVEEGGATRFTRTFDYKIDGIFGSMYQGAAEELQAHARHAQGMLGTLGRDIETLVENPIDAIIGELIAKDGSDSLEAVKQILESMPC